MSASPVVPVPGQTHRRRRWPVMAAGLLTTALLGACSPGEMLAGMHPPPAENRSVAPITPAAAQRIAARVLQSADTAATLPGDDAGNAARAAVLTGTAAELEKARLLVSGASPAPASLARPAPPKVLGISAGPSFPRVILATTLDEKTNRQYLETLVSTEVARPFVLENRVAMLPGSTLPGLGAVAVGAPLVDPKDASGLTISPQDALQAYAGELTFPTPVANDAVAATDNYATTLIALQKKLSDELGARASYTVTQTSIPEAIRAFRLADGSVVAFGRIDRVDDLQANASAKELTVPEAYQKLTGTATATSRISISFTQAVVLHLPAKGQGKATLIGVVEQVTGGSAS